MNTFFETVNPITIISFAIISTCVFMWLLRIRINTLEKTQANYLKQLTFAHLQSVFFAETNFHQKIGLLHRLEALAVQLYTEQPSAIPVQLAQLIHCYDQSLVKNLQWIIQKKPIKDALISITNLLLTNDSLTPERKKLIVGILVDSSDLGFLAMLHEAYRCESNSEILNLVISSKSSFEEFSDSFSIKNKTLVNQFHYLLLELKKRDDIEIRTIVTEWILRGGYPPNKTAKDFEYELNTGYPTSV